MADEDWERVIAANLSACFRLAREAARLMLAQGSGRIINTGSVGGDPRAPDGPRLHRRQGRPAGPDPLLAAELGRHGITVNAVAPGYFATEMNTALLEDRSSPPGSSSARRSAAGRSPRSSAAPWCSSPSKAGSYVNGHVLAVDGGLSVTL